MTIIIDILNNWLSRAVYVLRVHVLGILFKVKFNDHMTIIIGIMKNSFYFAIYILRLLKEECWNYIYQWLHQDYIYIYIYIWL